jgi:hypothetical protein
MLIPYFADVTFSPLNPAKAVALVHPGSPQTGPLYFRAFDVLGRSEALVRFRLSRHPSKATGGTLSTVQSFLDGAPTASAQTLSGDLTWPSDTANLSIVAQTMTRTAGGGVVFPSNNASGGAITLLPDHTLVFETLDGDSRGDYTLRLYWGEHAPMFPHLSTVLPAAGTFTAGTFFELPASWTAVTFVVAYTADGASTGARPKASVTWGRGTTTVRQPINSTALDASAQPVAARSQYWLDQHYPSAVTAGSTVTFAVPIDVLPGMQKVRLDLAELGDTAHPGAVVVGITGN